MRPGFEGGQTPMYRRFPKLKGIAGGMRAGKLLAGLGCECPGRPPPTPGGTPMAP